MPRPLPPSCNTLVSVILFDRCFLLTIDPDPDPEDDIFILFNFKIIATVFGYAHTWLLLNQGPTYPYTDKFLLARLTKFGMCPNYRTWLKLMSISFKFCVTNLKCHYLCVIAPPVTISLWPCDTIWRQRSGPTLAQVMACCLTAPSHYLNQCWLIIGEVPLYFKKFVL